MTKRHLPEASRPRRLLQALGLVFNDDGTWTPLHLKTRKAVRAVGAGGSMADELGGRTFRSVATSGRDLVRGCTIHVEFGNDGRLYVNAGCNQISGEVRWDGRHFSVEQLGMTEMGCEQALLDQDVWLAALLRSGVEVYLDGGALTLTGRRGALQLTDR